MLRKLISAALRRDVSEESPAADDDEAQGSSPPALAFAPMVPLRPPQPQNDNPLHAFCEAVEADLRAAGYLR
ncbi:hypothetical protein [Methylobacterium sp. J-068]|uniref:hypothetical protein n=1 Tax=Methylobacterium sp. J-068 TaxID=2836649 RepID=UPI001FB8AAD4|nr:hypothetical protein [Methylobacterium sp. J-068]MCJ2033288.1 hypothetical protein [Methylobacterium sp. J-068]